MIDNFEHMMKERLINYSRNEMGFHTLSMTDDVMDYIRFIDYLEDKIHNMEKEIEDRLSDTIESEAYDNGYTYGYEDGEKDGYDEGYQDALVHCDK